MLAKVLEVFVLLSVVNINNCLCCKTDTLSEIARCETITELKHLNVSLNSTIVYVGNHDKTDLSSIDSRTFKHIPDVKTLYLIGVVNNIARKTFENLVHLEELFLENNSLPVINEKTFEFTNIRSLSVNNCGVTDIQPHSFRNLSKLLFVTIENNNIPTIKENVFTSTNITVLNLSGNKIQFIDSNAFGRMQNLEQLNLYNNEITLFDAKLLFGSNSFIEILNLGKNKLKSFTKETFESAGNLEELLVGENEIETLTDNCLTSLKKIRKLDLSNNKIKEISPTLFPTEGLKSLSTLFVHGNQLCFLALEVFDRIPNLKSMSYEGNPWQCNCWSQINNLIEQKNIYRMCHEKFTDGLLPVCVVTEFQECIYDKEKLRHLPQTYYKEIISSPKITNCN